MRASARLRLAAPLLAAVFAARAVSAAPPKPPATTPNAAAANDAKRHFETGVKLYQEHVYAAALAEFEESYRLGGKAVALKNVAQCHRDMKQFAEAYDAYQQLLALHGSELKPKDKADVERSVAELAKVIATIEVSAEPTGAEVAIDGKVVGTTPLAAQHVDVGAHAIRISKAGYQPFDKQLTVYAEQRAAVSTALVPEVTTGHVVVREPSGKTVKVFVDDKEVGTTPWEGDLAPGTHTVKLVGDRVESETRTIDVALKGRLELDLPALATQGSVRVHVVPASAEVRVDGKVVGRGAFGMPLEPGTHVVEARAPGYEPQRTTVKVERGGEVAVNLVLVEQPKEAPPTTRERDYDEELGAHRFRGAYGQLTFAYQYPVVGRVGNADFQSPAELQTTSSIDNGPVNGGGATLRAGYDFDPIGIEFVGAFLGSNYGSTVHYQAPTALGPAAYPEALTVTTLAGFAGLGARVTSRDDAVRFSLGVSVGAIFRWYQLQDQVGEPNTPPSSTSNASTTWYAPMLGFDASVLLGKTPGTKFIVGVEGWLELPGNQDVTFAADRSLQLGNTPRTLSSGPYPAAKGATLYLGPHIGMAFGR